jgi:hypothetical protein
MNPILVVYTTRGGQTRRIAEHVAANLKRQGLSLNLLRAVMFLLGCPWAVILMSFLRHLFIGESTNQKWYGLCEIYGQSFSNCPLHCYL